MLYKHNIYIFRGPIGIKIDLYIKYKLALYDNMMIQFENPVIVIPEESVEVVADFTSFHLQGSKFEVLEPLYTTHYHDMYYYLIDKIKKKNAVTLEYHPELDKPILCDFSIYSYFTAFYFCVNETLINSFQIFESIAIPDTPFCIEKIEFYISCINTGILNFPSRKRHIQFIKKLLYVIHGGHENTLIVEISSDVEFVNILNYLQRRNDSSRYLTIISYYPQDLGVIYFDISTSSKTRTNSFTKNLWKQFSFTHSIRRIHPGSGDGEETPENTVRLYS